MDFIMPRLSFSSRKGFTLIELLIVVAIIAILSTVLILTLNPTELLRKARDATRSSDLNTLGTALNIFIADQTSGFLGTSTVVYVSIPDTTSTCANLGLPTLPSGYSYACATSSNYKKADGTGWIPVNLSSVSFGAPLSALPVDPVNTTSSRLYYTYMMGGSYELDGALESTAYKAGGSADKATTDGGDSPSQLEVGTNLTLAPIEYGDSALVGYWKFNEGSGTTVYDASGNGNTGTFSATAPVWDSGKFGGALRFSQASQWVIKNLTSSNPSALSVSFWFNVDSAVAGYRDMVGVIHGDTDRFHLENTYITWYPYAPTSIVPSPGQWYHVVGVFDGSTKKVYVNGVLRATAANSSITFSAMIVGADGEIFAGLIDDVRYYTRALSAAEVLALYNTTK